MVSRKWLTRTVQEALGLVKRQKPSLLLAVAGGCQGVFSSVQDSVSILYKKSIHVTTVSVINRHCISLCLGYDVFHIYHSGIPYVYVDSSYRSLSRGLLHLCHEDRSSAGREVCGLVDGRSRACCSWWQEGVEVLFSRVYNIEYLLCSENSFMSLLFLSLTVIVIYLWLRHDIFHMDHSVIPYVCADSSYRSLNGGLFHFCP